MGIVMHMVIEIVLQRTLRVTCSSTQASGSFFVGKLGSQEENATSRSWSIAGVLVLY